MLKAHGAGTFTGVYLYVAAFVQVTKACLVKIGIDKTGQKEIFKLLAVVLHLLNVAFVSGKPTSRVPSCSQGV